MSSARNPLTGNVYSKQSNSVGYKVSDPIGGKIAPEDVQHGQEHGTVAVLCLLPIIIKGAKESIQARFSECA